MRGVTIITLCRDDNQQSTLSGMDLSSKPRQRGDDTVCSNSRHETPATHLRAQLGIHTQQAYPRQSGERRACPRQARMLVPLGTCLDRKPKQRDHQRKEKQRQANNEGRGDQE